MKNTSLLSRAVLVIDAISRSRNGLGFTEISRLLENPSPSTVNKILKELVGEGILQKSAEKKYTLGRKVYFWGRVMASQNTPIQIIRQQMQRLHEQFRVSVNLFTCVDRTMFCLESYLDSGSPMLYPAGRSLSLGLNILGAVFFISAEQLEDRDFLSTEASKNEEPVTGEDLRKMIEYATIEGLQDDFGLFYPGIRRFAIPIQENGRTVMTLGVGMSAARARNAKLVEEITAQLKDVRLSVEEVMDQQT